MISDAAKEELKRIKRVADQSCSAHARLRDRYASQALAFDLLVLSASAWTLSLSFVDPKIADAFTPPGLTPTIWIGLMGVAIFIATLAQLKMNLRERSDAHKQACHAQAAVKQAAINAEQHLDEPNWIDDVQSKLALATAVGVPISENEFLKQKSIHLRKVAQSKHLDDHPYASLNLLRAKWWLRDNFGSKV